MNTITERYDRGWKHLEARLGRDTANTHWLIGVIITASAIVIAVLLATS